MTQSHLLEQAKQGDPQAIAALMNKSLQPKGMTAYVDRQGDHLEVVLRSDRIPNRQALTAFVEQGIHNLGIETIQSVTVSGQQIGASASAWTEKLYLSPLIPGFEPEDLSLTGTGANFDSEFDTLDADAASPGASISSPSEPTDLAQLQDLLLDQSEQSATEPQRQELENRLESLWAEQSEDEHQDFLSELMAEEPQDVTHQFEEFLAEDDRFQSQEQEGLWQPSAAQEADDLLADLNLEDSRHALNHQLQPETPYNWRESPEEDEPDEILFNFMEDQPQPPADLGLDEAGEPIDEPDEILPGFLNSLEPSSDLSPSALDFETNHADQGSIDFLNHLSADGEGLDFSAAAPESSDEELLDLLASEQEQEQDLLLELTGDRTTDRPTDQPTDRPIDWNDPDSSRVGEFSFNSSPDLIDELSLGVEEEPASSQIDFSAGEYPEASTDATSQDWEHPPIEFLQSELEPPSLEMPTEQFDAPADFTMEPPADNPDRPADFPSDFLQESPADQSHDLVVEPQTNPFIEQMEEQDRERSQKPEEKPQNQSSEELNQFDQSEWLLEDADPDRQPQELSGSQYSDPQYSDPQYSDQFNDQYSNQYGDSQYGSSPNLENADPLSDEALINFFEEDTDLNRVPDSRGTDFAGDISGDIEQSDYRVRPDNPDAPLYDSNQAGLGLDDSSYSYGDLGDRSYGDLGDRQDQPEELLDLSLEPDQPESSGYYADPQFPNTQIPTTQIPNTQIPDPTYSDQAYSDRIDDTQLSPYHEPSSADLEQQVAELYPEDNYGSNRSSSEVVEASSDSRGSPWLFPWILLGISGWIIGLISFAFLWSKLSSPPPDTAGTAPADVAASPGVAPTACPPTTDAVGNVPIALSELQFQQNQSNPQQINLSGCLTNRTPQPIDIVSIGYRSGTGSAPTIGGLNFSNGIIQPGQTVPFTSKFTLPSDTTDVAINTVYWQPAGQTTSKEANTSIDLNR